MRFAVPQDKEERVRKDEPHRTVLSSPNDPDLLSVAILSVTSSPLVVPDV